MANEEAIIKRELPHDREAERSVIGAMLTDHDNIMKATEILTPDDFYNKSLGVVFQAMVELTEAGKPADLITLQNKLQEKDLPPEITSMEFVRDLFDPTLVSYNMKYHAEIVAKKAVLRRLIRACNDVTDTCYQQKEELDSILDQTEKSIFNIVQKRNTGDFVPIERVVMNAMNHIERASKMQGTVTGIPTGFIDLDYKTAGLQPSDFILLAARPSMGKTALALNIAQHVAFRANECVAIFSLAEMRSKCRKYKLEHDLKLIIIDYLQLMSGSGKSDSRQQEVSDISRGLKSLARELNVPIISLSQLSRAVESRPDKRPMLSDLRESGAIEQDADVVMFIYRDDYYNHDSEKKGIAEVIIAKQRNGPIGTVDLAWMPEYTRFANLDRNSGEH